ncbi:MAG TPA: hypothetical protein PK358_13965 [Spirochaetota bacterium]|nr:hypothetical protein [Spirochaetota bacterium]HPJ35940.1 hypothetical protein [Spirochaetota bacterium]
MPDIYNWDQLGDEEKNTIMKFVAENNSLVREVMRKEFPSLYIGRATDEVAKGWLMIAGLDKVMNFIRKGN